MYTTPYTFGIETDLKIDEARRVVEENLQEIGFGILTEIDVKATMKKKLGVEFRPYLILGACNPQIAHEAFKKELEIGSLLPCNVILYENDSGGTNVAFMDPLAALNITGNSELTQQAQQVRDLLEGVVKRLQSGIAH
jgi:uncharacterized protein (DUF302 family)